MVHSVMALWTEMAFVPPGSQAPGTCLPLVLPVVLVLGCQAVVYLVVVEGYSVGFQLLMISLLVLVAVSVMVMVAHLMWV